MYTIKVIEHVTFMYLRSMSFNQVNAILRSFYERDVFTKATLLDHIEQMADRIPDHQSISRWLKPKRSGYYAIDGTWIKYRGEERVLLILFDVHTLDYQTIPQARLGLTKYFQFYNKERFYQSLNNKTPWQVYTQN